MSEPSPTPAGSPPIAHAEAKAGGLLLLTLLLAAAFVYYVMQARGVFEETQSLLLVAENSEGVTVGMDLGFAGFPIGRVTRIELGDDGKAHLHIAVPLRDARWLRSSSVFTRERGVVGGTRLRAFTGILDDPPLPDGAQREVLIGDASSGIPELLATVNRLVGNLERLTAEQSALAESLAQVRQFTTALNGRHGALGALLGNEKDAARMGERRAIRFRASDGMELEGFMTLPAGVTTPAGLPTVDPAPLAITHCALTSHGTRRSSTTGVAASSVQSMYTAMRW